MDAEFWHSKWERGEIGFHNSEVNPLLARNWPCMGHLGGTVFVPLCGKTLDIAWLLGQGYAIAGAELSEKAVQALFDELGVAPDVTVVADEAADQPLKLWQANGIRIFSGDIFKLTAELLGPVDLVYDRAAMVALPAAVRVEYAQHLVSLTGSAPQLLICFEYDQSKMPGPPFSVEADEVHQNYRAYYNPQLLESVEVEGGMKGKTPATEKVWLLDPVS